MERTARVGRELDRIEEAVAGGADIRTLGFWPLVGEIKRDRYLSLTYAEQVGRIDTAAFRAWTNRRISIRSGNTILLLGALLGVAAVVVAAIVEDPLWKGLLMIAAGIDWSVTLHSPTHVFVGWLFGIRFTDYFLGGPPPPRPGVKTDHATYLRAAPSGRAWMHASGALATKVAPFLALAVVPLVGAPWWSAAVLAAIGVVQIVTDVTLSTKSSDWKKFLREKRVGREQVTVAEPVLDDQVEALPGEVVGGNPPAARRA
jgi:hypothetical protein